MKRAIFAVISILLYAAPALSQTNPCDAPLAPFVIVTDPSKGVVAHIPDYTRQFNGQSVVVDVELKVVPKGAGSTAPAIQNGSIVNPKSEWVLVPGTTDCYQVGTVGQFLFGVPTNTDFELWARPRNAAQQGDWSQNSVPFGRRGPAAAMTGVRIP